MKKPTQRILWLDLVRIVAIGLVVFTHSLGSQIWTPMGTQTDWIINDLYSSLARICVPLFIMVSGALLLDKVESYKVFFSKRFTKVLLPWILWTCIYMIWNLFYNGVDVSTPYAFTKAFYVIFMSQFWFLPMITGLYLLTPILRIWLKHAARFDVYYALALWFILYSLYPFAQKLISSDYAIPVPFVLEHLGYFLLGFVIFHWIKSSKYTITLLILFLLSIIGNSVGTFIGYGIDRPELKSYFWNNMSFFVITATTASFLLLRNLFEKKAFAKGSRTNRTIITLSNASFGIFLIHVLIIEAMEKIPPPFPIPYPLASPLHAMIVYAISLGIILLIQKTPMRKLLAT